MRPQAFFAEAQAERRCTQAGVRDA